MRYPDSRRAGVRRHRRRRSAHTTAALLLSLGLLAAGCTSEDPGEAADDAAGDGDREVIDERSEGACDPTDETHCLLPWPSDSLTRFDPSTSTGLRLDIPSEAMPTNAQGRPIDTTEWNRNDGFSPASVPQTVIPDLDPDASGLAVQGDIGTSLEPGSNLVLVDLDSGERVPAWAEIDINVSDPARAPLRVIPARALAEGHRHAVGLFDLVRDDGSDVEPSEAFAAILAEPDADQSEWLGSLLGGSRSNDELDLAWSFTVASTRSLTGRLRHMWAETSADLGLDVDPTDPGAAVRGGGSPPFTVTSDEVAGSTRIVSGSFEMPKYLTGDGGTGTVLANDGDPDGLPSPQGTMDAPFTCVVPNDPVEPVPFVVYGHGLLGDRSEVLDIGGLGASVGIGFCALDYIGMSRADLPTVLEEFKDLSGFRTQPDRLQQGHLGFLLLARLLADREGFAGDPAFQDSAGASIVMESGISFLGASQGGILGGPAVALSPDMDRAIFAVGGMGYNLLLRRSIDFDQFLPVLAEAYPDELEAALSLELAEQLWDRGENAGWAQHITEDPFPESGGPSTVMLLEAFGDHQVANVSTEKLARTLGVQRVSPTLAEGRSEDADPFWGIEEIPSLPHDGSALVVWDFGTPAPPSANTPPRDGEDPHGKLSEVTEALVLVAAFARPDGQVIEVCGADPCASPG